MKINLHPMDDAFGIVVNSETDDELMEIVKEKFREKDYPAMEEDFLSYVGFMVGITVLEAKTHVEEGRFSSFAPQVGVTFFTFPACTAPINYSIRLDECGQIFYQGSMKAIPEEHRDIFIAILDSTVTVDKDDHRKASEGADSTVMSIWKLLVKEWNRMNAEVTGYAIPEMHRPAYETIMTDEEYRFA